MTDDGRTILRIPMYFMCRIHERTDKEGQYLNGECVAVGAFSLDDNSDSANMKLELELTPLLSGSFVTRFFQALNEAGIEMNMDASVGFLDYLFRRPKLARGTGSIELSTDYRCADDHGSA